MPLFLEVIGDEKRGAPAAKRIELRDGLLIGRKTGDLILRDPKVSSAHARVELRDNRDFWLVDQGSMNGIKCLGQRLRELFLEDRIEFTLGQTMLRVVYNEHVIPAVFSASALDHSFSLPAGFLPEVPAPAAPLPTEGFAHLRPVSPKPLDLLPAEDKRNHQPEDGADDVSPPGSAAKDAKIAIDPKAGARSSALEPEKNVSWSERLSALTKQAALQAPREGKPLLPFGKQVRLEFVAGIQTGTVWTLGYGPRAVGSKSVDLRLEDDSAPGLCFRLAPNGDGVLYTCEADQDVRLNGRWVKSQLLENGDFIEIKNTKIKVILEF